MKNKVALYDILFFLVIPLIVWNYGRGILGDYPAMLLSSVPGIVYSLFRFIALKQFNVFGIFMLVTLLSGAALDLLAGSAIQLLWNKVYYTYAVGAVFLLTVFIKKPLAMYFALDMAELQGQNRDQLKILFSQKKLFIIFQLITFGFVVRDVVLATIKVWLISTYGVDAFDKGIILRQTLNWSFSLLFVIGFFFVLKAIQEANPEAELLPKKNS